MRASSSFGGAPSSYSSGYEALHGGSVSCTPSGAVLFYVALSILVQSSSNLPCLSSGSIPSIRLKLAVEVPLNNISAYSDCSDQDDLPGVFLHDLHVEGETIERGDIAFVD